MRLGWQKLFVFCWALAPFFFFGAASAQTPMPDTLDVFRIYGFRSPSVSTSKPGAIRLYDPDSESGRNYVQLRASYSLATSYHLVLPRVLPSPGEFLKAVTADSLAWGTNSLSGVTVREVDASPSISNITVLEFENANGLVVTNPSGTIARVDLASTVSKLGQTIETGEISDGTLLNSDIAAGAAISLSKLAAGTSAQVPVADGTGVLTYRTIGGDVVMSNVGIVTISNNVISSSHISDGVITEDDVNANIAGSGLVLTPGSPGTLDFAPSELTNITFSNGGSATATLTMSLSGATDPVLNFGNNLLNITGAQLQENGADVFTLGDGPLPIANGGTQTATAPSDGQLLVGKTNGTYALANLTEGSNITITNGDGTIMIAATGTGETNTASNLGGGLANFDSKSGVDLRFNTFAAADFDLATNLLTIDDTRWAKDSELHAAVTLAGENYLSLSTQQIMANAVNLSGTHVTGTLAAARFPALTGDVTTSAGSLTTAIGSDKITESMLKFVNAAGDEKIATYEATGGDFEWHTPDELSLITAVGPAYASGDAFVDGVVSSGTVMLVWEGTTADGNELSIISPSANPGADIDITLPSATGTLATLAGTETLTNKTINGASNTLTVIAGQYAAGSIVNADVSGSAAIALSKLANGSSAQIIVANGSGVWTNVAMSGDGSMSNAGALTVNDDSHSHADGTIANDLTLATVSGAIDAGGATSFEVPNGATPTVDAFGEIAGDNNQWAAGRGALVTYDGTAVTALLGVLTSDTPSAGEIPKFNSDGTITWESDNTGGTPLWSGLAAPTGTTSFVSDGTSETFTIDFQAAFTTGSQFVLKQSTGNPSGGILADIQTADADVTPFRLTAQGTSNGVQMNASGVLAVIGTGQINANRFNGASGALTDDDLSNNNVDDFADVTITSATATHILVRNSGNTAFENVAISGDASLAANGALTVSDNSHAHTGSTLSGIDVSDDLNLVAGTNITLTGDQLDVDDVFVLNTGDVIAGNLDFSDGSGASPQALFTPASGTVWGIYTEDTGDDLQVEVNTASTETVDFVNVGAGVVNVTIDGTLTASNFSGSSSNTNTGDVTLAGENYLSLASQTLTANAVNLSGTHVTGTLAAGRFPALTGHVTNSAGSLSTTISNNVVTAAMLANGDHGAFTYASNVASLDASSVSGGNGGIITDNSITADDIGADAVGASELATDALLWNEIGDAGANGSVGFGATVQTIVASQTSGDVSVLTLDINQVDDAAATDDLIAFSIDGTSESGDAGDTFTLMRLLYENGTANTILDRALLIDNAETTASTMTDAILITSSGADGGVVDAIDVSAGNITNAINIGSNNIITAAATIASTEIDRLDGLSGVLVTDATAVTDIDGAGLTISGTTLNIGAGTAITVNANDVAVTADGIGPTQLDETANYALSGANTVTGSMQFDGDALRILDAGADHYLTITPGTNLTANRVLTITTGDATRTLTMTGDASITGTNTGDQTITLSGDVTGSGTSGITATIANDAVTFAKFQNITDARLLGRSAGSSGDMQEITIGSGLSLSGGELSASGGSASWSGLTAPTGAVSLVSDGTSETVTFDFQAAFTTGNQYTIKQTTGNPTGGSLFAVQAADADVSPIAKIENTAAVTIATGLQIAATNASGVLTTALDLSDAKIVAALALGANDVTVGGVTIGSAEFALLDGLSGTIATLAGAEIFTNKTISGATLSGAISASGASSFIIPISGGAAPTADGSIAYDNTQDRYTAGGAGAVTGSFPRVLAVGHPAQSFTNSTASDQDYTSLFTIPANYLIENKVIRVTIGYQYTTGSSTVTISNYFKLGSTKVYTNTATDLSNSITRSGAFVFLIYGTAAAGASVNVETIVEAGTLFNSASAQSAGTLNNTTQPVALATNGTLAITPGVTYSGTGSTETLVLRTFLIEELN